MGINRSVCFIGKFYLPLHDYWVEDWGTGIHQQSHPFWNVYTISLSRRGFASPRSVIRVPINVEERVGLEMDSISTWNKDKWVAFRGMRRSQASNTNNWSLTRWLNRTIYSINNYLIFCCMEIGAGDGDLCSPTRWPKCRLNTGHESSFIMRVGNSRRYSCIHSYFNITGMIIRFAYSLSIEEDTSNLYFCQKASWFACVLEPHIFILMRVRCSFLPNVIAGMELHRIDRKKCCPCAAIHRCLKQCTIDFRSRGGLVGIGGISDFVNIGDVVGSKWESHMAFLIDWFVDSIEHSIKYLVS